MLDQVKAGSDEARALLPVLLACSFAASFGQSMMNIALPQVAEGFGVTLSTANWLITGYMVVAATSITLAAFLLKRLGLRAVFFIGGGALALGCGLAMLAPDFLALLGCRLVQAVCTGLFYPTVTSFIMTNSAPERRGTHLAMNSGTVAVGLAVSPVVSGLVLTYFGWRAMFALPFALAAVLLVVGFFRLRDIGPRERVTADPLSAVLSLVGLSALIYGLGEVSRDLMPSLVALAVGVVVLGLFAWRQFALKTPLLNLRPLGQVRFAAGELLVMLGMMASFSLSILLPLYYEGAVELTAFFAGLLMLGPVLVNALFTVLGGRLLDWRGIWPLVPCGFGLVAVGLAGVALAAGHLTLALVALASAVAYAGLGLVVSPSKTTALSQLPPALYAHGSSINSAFIQIASAIGSSLFVGVLSADVLAGTAAGMSKADAYGVGFAHTLEIAIGIGVVSLAFSLVYAYRMRTRRSS